MLAIAEDRANAMTTSGDSIDSYTLSVEGASFRHKVSRAAAAFQELGYSKRVAEDWALSTVTRDWEQAVRDAREYLDLRVPPTYAWKYYELDILAARAKELHRRGWTPSLVTALEYEITLGQIPGPLAADGRPRTIENHVARTKHAERLAETWIGLGLRPEYAIQYVRAGVALGEVEEFEEQRDAHFSTWQKALDLLIALRRQVGGR